ncbi:MAG: hypothetical protein KAT78_07910 [Flavobacteriaceae bacterium]|nr:hypothetical protein [Flavobacteriaceae bacterium]
MKFTQNTVKYLLVLIILFSLTKCKTQVVKQKAPFEIVEKTYFYFAGGKKGTNGTTIKLVGKANTLNLGFTTIFFQNHEYKIIPEFNTEKFILVGSNTEIRKNDLNMHRDAVEEYGNEVPKLEKKFPFDLEKNEAVLVYRINGEDFYYKITDIKQLKTVYYP